MDINVDHIALYQTDSNGIQDIQREIRHYMVLLITKSKVIYIVVDIPKELKQYVVNNEQSLQQQWK